MKTACLAHRSRRRQRGVFGIIFTLLLLPLLAMIGLALDLAVVYARKQELQAIADAAALAAARGLNGTETGVAAAITAASNVVQQSRYNFLHETQITWSSAALSFAVSQHGPWTPAASAGPGAAGLLFARFDTAALDAAPGTVNISFMKLLGHTSKPLTTEAVAGRRDTQLAPLAICALSDDASAPRTNPGPPVLVETVEFGFRRGISYNLLNLNPKGLAPVHFLFNPINYPPQPSTSSSLSEQVLKPLLCTGAIPAAPLPAGASVYLGSPFPAAMVEQLNVRFSQYNLDTGCSHYSAPPDANLYDYRGWYATQTAPLGSAASHSAGNALMTIADAATPPAGTKAVSYGPLWAFARPLRWNGGGAQFSKSDWAALYPVASGAAPTTSYSGALPPYESRPTIYNTPSTVHTGLRNRRVLNVALLQCPVDNSGTATVLGIGRFLMTTPATASPLAIHAEFGGATTYGALAGPAVLYK